MDIPGLGGCRCVEKGARFSEPLFPKNVALVSKEILVLDFGWVLTFGSDLAKL